MDGKVKMKRCTWFGARADVGCVRVGCVLSVLASSLVVLVGGSVGLSLEELSSGLFDSVSFNVTHLTVDSVTGK